jgi:transcriptional regulator with XRE-family HTH domain
VRTFRGRKAVDAMARSASLARRSGTELRIARMAAGLTQRQVGHLAGVTQQLVSLAERGDPGIRLEVRCRLVAAAGHELGWKLYPVAGVSLRDSGQLHLAQAILSALSTQLTARMEVPIGAGDLRAADLLITAPAELIHVEVERSLFDLQAQVRAAQLKRDAIARDSTRPVRLVIAVPDSARARAVVGSISEIVRAAFPIPSRQIASALRNGAPIGGDGLLFVRAARRTSQARRT